MRSKRSGFLLSAALIFAVVFGLAFNVSAAQTSEWLSTSRNHIYKPDGSIWVGRGANLRDTRACDTGYNFDAAGNHLAPMYDNATGVNEVKRRTDVLVDQWKATFIRLVLESARSQDSYNADANYRATIKEIVDYIGTKPGVYVLVSVLIDPSLDATTGWPTDGTNAILYQLAQDFYAYPYVLYGVSNEPKNNSDGALDAQVWARMNSAVTTIRSAESSLGSNRHIITVQGTRDYARDISYYVSHPITAGGGVNIAYETHVYNTSSAFDTLFVTPSQKIPVIIGEFGPTTLSPPYDESLSDAQILMDLAKSNNIPYLAWNFHEACPPNLIAGKADMTYTNTTSVYGDGIGMTIYPTDFGKLLMCNLSTSACTYTLSHTSQAVASTGGTDSITVTASSSSASWTATSSLSWVTITSGSSGTGNGTVTISVSANTTGATRTGNITIAGQTFTITQSATQPVSLVVATPASQTYFDTIQAAYNGNTASSGSSILAQGVTLTENLLFNRGNTITLTGGYDSSYSSVGGTMTTVHGSLTISGGQVTVGNIVIQ